MHANVITNLLKAPSSHSKRARSFLYPDPSSRRRLRLLFQTGSQIHFPSSSSCSLPSLGSESLRRVFSERQCARVVSFPSLCVCRRDEFLVTAACLECGRQSNKRSPRNENDATRTGNFMLAPRRRARDVTEKSLVLFVSALLRTFTAIM